MKNLLFGLKTFALTGFFAVALMSCGEGVDTDSTRDAMNGTDNAAMMNQNQNNTIQATDATNPQTNQPQQAAVDPATLTTMTFDEMKHDFGTIKQGEQVEHIFKFTNTGDKPLTITNAKGSCGCTVPSYPKEPVAPGESGEILVKFDSKGKKGDQPKRVTLTANTNPPQTVLNITSNVVTTETE